MKTYEELHEHKVCVCTHKHSGYREMGFLLIDKEKDLFILGWSTYRISTVNVYLCLVVSM